MQESPTETIYKRVCSAAEEIKPQLVALIGASVLGVLLVKYQPSFDHDRVRLVEDNYTGHFDRRRSDFPEKMLTCESSFTGIDVSCQNNRKIYTAYYCQTSTDNNLKNIETYRVMVGWNATCDPAATHSLSSSTTTK